MVGAVIGGIVVALLPVLNSPTYTVHDLVNRGIAGAVTGFGAWLLPTTKKSDEGTDSK